MNKLIVCFKKCFTYDDFLFVVGFVFVFPLAIINAFFMNGDLDSNPPFPWWIGLIFGIFSLLLSLIYIFINLRKKSDNLRLIILCIFCALFVINTITTICSPSSFTLHSKIKSIWLPNYGSYVDVPINITTEMKIIFIIQYGILLFYIFSIIFVFANKITDLFFLVIFGYLIYLVFVASIIYSLFTELHSYADFFSCLFHPDGAISSLPDYSLTSFFGHRNIYSIFLFVVVMISLFMHALTKQKRHLFLTAFVLLYSIFTFSKTILLLSYIGVLVYFYIYSFACLKSNKQFKIQIIVVSIVITVCLLTVILLYFLVSSVQNIIKPLITYTGTISSRKGVWETVLEYLQPCWFISGRGYGIGISILNNVGPIVIGEKIAHEHSWFYSLLSKGGIILIISYLVFIAYSSYLFYKSIRQNWKMTLPLLLGFVVIFIHSFVENSYYVLFGIVALLVVILSNSEFSSKLKPLYQEDKNGL